MTKKNSFFKKILLLFKVLRYMSLLFPTLTSPRQPPAHPVCVHWLRSNARILVLWSISYPLSPPPPPLPHRLDGPSAAAALNPAGGVGAGGSRHVVAVASLAPADVAAVPQEGIGRGHAPRNQAEGCRTPRGGGRRSSGDEWSQQTLREG